MIDTQPIDPPPDSPTECSFTHTASYRDAVPLEKLRSEVETLSNSETLDKNAALQMTRLFHAMELFTTRNSTLATHVSPRTTNCSINASAWNWIV